jgi:cell division septum initiation protein DivIVA
MTADPELVALIADALPYATEYVEELANALDGKVVTEDECRKRVARASRSAHDAADTVCGKHTADLLAAEARIAELEAVNARSLQRAGEILAACIGERERVTELATALTELEAERDDARDAKANAIACWNDESEALRGRVAALEIELHRFVARREDQS